MKKILFIVFLFICACSSHTQSEKPLIGISCSHPSNNSSVRRTYSESVLKAGGIPILIPVMEDQEALADILNRIDGLILTGGEDIHPSYYGEKPIEQLGDVNDVRDVYDLALIRLASSKQIPMLGICRGEQLINVAFGGTLYQDIPTQYPDTTVHHQQAEPSSVPTHTVLVLHGSAIEKITGQTRLFTNTHHHQAVKDVAPGFRISAWATDSIAEAIEAMDGRPIWAVQFHPEGLTMAGDSIMEKFFHFLTEQALLFHNKK